MQTSSPLMSRDEAAMIAVTDAAETVALRRCDACGFELTDRNKFCRQCGVRQHNESIPVTSLATGQPLSSNATSALATNDLRSALVIAVGSASLTARLSNPMARTLVVALFAVPVWLIIILLSPLDAWAAAKSAVNRTHAIEMKNQESNLCSEA